MKVTRLFAVNQEMMVHIESYEKEFLNYGLVKLIIGNKDINCKCVGVGSTAGEPIIVLTLEDKKYSNVKEVEKLFNAFKGHAFVEQ